MGSMAEVELQAEVDGGPLSNTTSVFAHIEQGLLKHPHEKALICMNQNAGHLSHVVPANLPEPKQTRDEGICCLSLTYTQIHRAALLWAAGMLTNGAKPGMMIATFISNGAEYNIFLWLAALMRLTLVSLDTTLLHTSDASQLRSLLELSNPDIIVVPDLAGTKAIDAILQASKSPPLRIFLDGDATNGWLSLADLLYDAQATPIDEEAFLDSARNDDPDRMHSIHFTPGSLSTLPKGLPQRVAAITHLLHAQSWLIHPSNCGRVLVQAHNSHALTRNMTLQTWRQGGAVITGTSFTPGQTLDAVLRYRATFLVLFPAMLPELAQQLSSGQDQLASVRTVQLRGETITRDDLLQCAALFPNAVPLVNYDMLGGGGLFQWPFLNTPVSQIPSMGEIVAAGVVAPGAKVRVVNAKTQTVTHRGMLGELHVNCEAQHIPRFLDGTIPQAIYHDHGGRWTMTGLLAIMQDDGLVYVLGQRRDVIKRGNIAVNPAVLESCISKFTGASTAVVAIPHKHLGQVPFAILNGLANVDELAVKQAILHSLGPDHVIAGLATLEMIGLTSFPLNNVGKVSRFDLQVAVMNHLRRKFAG